MLWLQSLLSLWNEGRAYGISPAKSSVHEGIYLFPEFKHQKHFFSPSNSNFPFVIYLNLLSAYWFCKIYYKKLLSQIQVLSNCMQPDWAEEASPFAGFSSSWIDFIIGPPELSSEFITDYLFLLAESRQRWDCRAQLLKGSSFTSALILILTYLVLLWKSCLPEIRQINKWYPEYRVHKIGCRNLGAKI